MNNLVHRLHNQLVSKHVGNQPDMVSVSIKHNAWSGFSETSILFMLCAFIKIDSKTCALCTYVHIIFFKVFKILASCTTIILVNHPKIELDCQTQFCEA